MSDLKYHISPKTGNPNRCYAETKPCPLGGKDDHYSSKEEARAGYEKRMREETSVIPKSQSSKTKDPSLSKLSEEEKFEVRERWERLVEIDQKITSVGKTLDKGYRNLKSLEKAGEAYQTARRNEELPADSFRGGQANKDGVVSSHARQALKHLQATRPWSLNQTSEPSYPNHEFSDLTSIKIAIDDTEQKTLSEIREKEFEIDELYEDESDYSHYVESTAGYSEDPRYGVPTGEKTKEKFAGQYAKGYSSMPTRDVDVLEKSERFCTKCNKPVTYDQKSYSWQHPGGEPCGDSSSRIVAVNPVCNYCGTGNPARSSYSQEAYSDQTSCSRCGGVSGYAIGD